MAIIFVLSSAAIFCRRVFSYDTNVAHPFLTAKAVSLFNQSATVKITDREKQWITSGAVNEDTPIRWMNHFYDPATGKGLWGFQTARDWAQSPKLQDWYPKADQSWQKAVNSYIDRDFEAAFTALGHVLHLVEDMAVPAHTRMDIHPKGDPYEQWVKNNSNQAIATLPVKNFNNPNDYFVDLATYSNKYFLSEDTFDTVSLSYEDTFIEKIDNKNIECVEGKIDNTQDRFCLIVVKEDPFLGKTYWFKNDVVNSDYFSLLAPKAVSYGAGVIDLFFKEVERKRAEMGKAKQSNSEFSNRLVNELTQTQPALGIDAGEMRATNESQSELEPTSVQTVKHLAIEESPTLEVKSDPVPAVENEPIMPENSVVENVAPMVPAPTVNPAPLLATPSPAPAAGSGGGSGGGGGGNTGGGSSDDQIEENNNPPADTTPPPAPIFNILFSDVVYTTNTNFSVSGSVSTDTVKIFVYYSTTGTIPSQPTDEITVSSTVWNKDGVLNAGHNYFYFAAADTAGNTSTLSAPAHFVLDTDPPPTPILTISNQSGINSTNIHISLSGADALSPTKYSVAFRLSSSSEWLDVATSSVQTEFDFSGARGCSYFFRARAQDALGNISSWSAETGESVEWSRQIVINEIAWAGTSNVTTADEWLELYNNTDTDLVFVGADATSSWKILVNGTPVVFKTVANAVVPAHGYYLLERTSDDTVKNVAADAVFTFSSGFNNGGAKIEIFSPNNEKVDEADCSAGWFAGNAVEYRTMERLDTLVNGNDASNWQSNQGPRVGPQTAKGGYVYGSPKLSNFGQILIKETQANATATWTRKNSPYVLWYYTIPAGKILNIEPGVEIKNYDQTAKVDVYGTLNANGTETAPVVFTSGSGAPSARDWQGLKFYANSTGAFSFAHIDYTNTAVSLNGAAGNFSHCQFTDGVQAIEAANSTLSVSDSGFSGFGGTYGPLYVKNIWPTLSNLSFENNSIDMPYLSSVVIGEGSHEIKNSAPAIYATLTVGASSTLNIEAGSRLYMPAYNSIIVNGTLNANGTESARIGFEPYPADAYWAQISFVNSTSVLKYADFKRANRHVTKPVQIDGILLADNSRLDIENCVFDDIYEAGNDIQSFNSVLRIKDSLLADTEKSENQRVPNRGIKAGGGELTLDNATLQNLSFGLWANYQGYEMPILTTNNMTSANFINVDRFWEPTTWYSFPTST